MENETFALTICVACGGNHLRSYLDLGFQPLANSFAPPESNLKVYPLETNVCLTCFHSQLSIAVQPDLLFRDYAYVSGVQVSNGYVHRAILALDDLCEALPNILSSHRNSFGLLNIGSFNTTVDEIATTVAMITGAELKIRPSSSTYDFTMATRKASDTFGFNPKYDIKMLVQKLVNFFSNEGAQQLTKYSQQSSQ